VWIFDVWPLRMELSNKRRASWNSRHGTATTRQSDAFNGIPPIILEWLKQFGSHAPDGKGCDVVWFDKKSRRQMSREIGEQVVDRLGHLLDAYLVCDKEGVLVTVGWRYKRLPR